MNDDDLYSDLPEETTSDYIKKLETEVEMLRKRNRELDSTLAKSEIEQRKLSHINKILKRNISSLFKTARSELERKENMLNELRAEFDNMAFRRRDYNNRHKHSTYRNRNEQRHRNPEMEDNFAEKLRRHQVPEVEERNNSTERSRNRYEERYDSVYSRRRDPEKNKSIEYNTEKRKQEVNLEKSRLLDLNHEKSRALEYGNYEWNKLPESSHDRRKPEISFERNKFHDPSHERITPREKSKSLESNSHEKFKSEPYRERNKVQINHEKNNPLESNNDEKIKPEPNREQNEMQIHEKRNSENNLDRSKNKSLELNNEKRKSESSRERNKPQINRERRKVKIDVEKTNVIELNHEKNKLIENNNHKGIKPAPNREQKEIQNYERRKQDSLGKESLELNHKENPLRCNNHDSSLKNDHDVQANQQTNKSEVKPAENLVHLENCDQVPYDTPRKFINGELTGFPFKYSLKLITPIRDTPDCLKEKLNALANSTVRPVVPMLNEHRMLDNHETMNINPDDVKFIGNPTNTNLISCEEVASEKPAANNSSSIGLEKAVCDNFTAAISEKLTSDSSPSLTSEKSVPNSSFSEISEKPVPNSSLSVTSEKSLPNSSFSVLSVNDAVHGAFSRKGRKRPVVQTRVINVKKICTSS